MEKISLPIKTKIAAWWITIYGVIIIIFGLFLLYSFLVGGFAGIGGGEMFGQIGLVITVIFIGYSILNSSHFLLKGKKHA